MATIVRNRRLVNPGRKRKMSPAQIRFFGTKRQRAASKAKLAHGWGYNKRSFPLRSVKKIFNKGRQRNALPKRMTTRRYKKIKPLSAKVRMGNYPKRKRNVGSVITVWPKGHSANNPGRRKRYKRNGAKNRLVIVNPGTQGSGRVISKYGSTVMNKGRKRMAIQHRRKVVVHRRKRRAIAVNPRRRRRTRRIRNVVYRGRVKRGMYKYNSNPGRRRHRNVSYRRQYRRNPGVLTGTVGRVLGVVGGVALTKVLTGFLPTSFSTGILGYVSIGAIAILQGKLAAKFSKSSALGNDILVGGLAYLTAKVLNDFFPSIGSYTGISGMGLIGGSSFYNPQVNLNGSMGNFVVPSAVMGAMPILTTAKGVGSVRRTGRFM